MDYPALERAARRHATAELTRHAVSELDLIASGSRTLRAVRHPLGFDSLPVLLDGADRVCVHVCGTPPAEPADTVPHVHCHFLAGKRRAA